MPIASHVCIFQIFYFSLQLLIFNFFIFQINQDLFVLFSQLVNPLNKILWKHVQVKVRKKLRKYAALIAGLGLVLVVQLMKVAI